MYSNKRCSRVDDNPFDFETVKKNIEKRLILSMRIGFALYWFLILPIFVMVEVGYKMEEIVLSGKFRKFQLAKIRAKMRKEGKLTC